MNNQNGQESGMRTIDHVNASLKKRYARERRFKFMGLGAVLLGLFFVSLLFVTILANGLPAFQQTYIKLDIDFDEQVIDPEGTREPEAIARADFSALVKTALRERFPDVTGRSQKRELYSLISGGAPIDLHRMVREDPDLIGTRQSVWLLADDEVDMLVKGVVTDVRTRDAVGIGSVVIDGSRVKVLSTSNDFADILARIKAAIGDMARQADKAVARLAPKVERAERSVAEIRENLTRARAGADDQKAAKLETALEEAEREFQSLTGQRETLARDASELRERAETPGGAGELSAEMPSYLVRINGGVVKLDSVSNTGIEGDAVIMPSEGDAAPGEWSVLTYTTPEAERRLKDASVTWVGALADSGAVEKKFNTVFFTAGDSREPEQAGIGGAVAGSFFTLLVTLALSFPIGVAAALYLEEFAPKNRWTDLIEVNINNLAAVPSIVFGLLGLAVFINFFGLPRSAPLVGGLVLTLMTLPTIIIASRAALKSVPPSIREAALGVGASKMQTMFHHVLPLAMPGMLTGTIIGMAQALGETAPLLMIGMVAFIVDIPGGPLDPSAVLPVQIFLWADSPERAFVAKTSAAIIVLLAFLIAMNALAVVLRRRFERRW